MQRTMHFSKSNRIRKVLLRAAVAWALSGSGWALANPTGQFRIHELGLTDSAHTSTDPGNYRLSGVLLMNDAGTAVGYSARLENDVWLAASSWISDGTLTLQTGLTDAQHTATDGFQFSATVAMNDAGQVAGYSTRYNSAGENGQSAWVFSAGQTHRTGLIGAAYTGSGGFQFSDVTNLNSRGQAAGHSLRFFGDGSDAGQSAWIYTSGMTRQIGFVGPAFTRNDGYQLSAVLETNDAGRVAGASMQYSGGSELGFSSWIYDGTNTHRIGLTDPSHTGTGGLQDSTVTKLNQAGEAMGIATRYSGDQPSGQSAWFYDTSVSTRIGLVDAAHTAFSGTQNSGVTFLNDSGTVAGTSTQFIADEAVGETPWLYHGGATTPVGLNDATHTGSDGRQTGLISFLNQAGDAAGSSSQFSGTLESGSSAWVYDGSTTTRAGFFDPVHTRSNGSQYSEVRALNAAGQAVGVSDRYNGINYNGSSAWFFSAGSTHALGLSGDEFIRADGYQSSSPAFLNDQGQVVGTTDRFDGSTARGQSAWFYDASSQTTSDLTFSLRDDGDAYTRPQFLCDDGAVVGMYEKNAGTLSVGTFGFYWSKSDGFHELATLVNGGLTTAGWNSINQITAVTTSPSGQHFIAGQGRLITGQDMAFVMTPIGGGAWINPAGGAWEMNGNWSLNAPPTFADDAVFNLNSTYAVTFSHDSQAHDLTVSSGTVTLDLSGHQLRAMNQTHVDGARLKLAHGTLKTSGLAITGGGQIDLVDQKLIIDYSGSSPINGLLTSIASARNGGAWDGAGLTSSEAATDPRLAVGIAENSSLNLFQFGDVPVDSSSLLVEVTWAGDANLDGKVDVGDLLRLAQSWQQSGAGWSGGDFNYNGIVDATDLGILSMNWQAGLGAQSAPLDQILAGLGIVSQPVPEPLAGTLLIVLVTCAAASRRRIRSKPPL